MKRLIKRTLRIPYVILCVMLRFNIIKTLMVNFSLLPFNQAIKLPVVVLGRLKLGQLNGKIILNCPVKFGTLIIGKRVDNMPIETNTSRLLVAGVLVIEGKCIFAHSSNVCVWPGGKIIIGKHVVICSGVLLKSACLVKIGSLTRITSGCFVMDTNVHAIKDIETGIIKRILTSIEIGKCCWLTMNTSVTGGAKIPDYSISVRNSTLNRDYTKTGEIGCMLAGSPAKIIKSNVQRIFNPKTESAATKYFTENPDAEYYQDCPGFERMEDTDNNSFFKIY